MSESTSQYLHRLNVIHLTRKLKLASDEIQRKTLLALLAEEEAKARAAGWPPMLG
jgi:hypothetical protein